MAENFSEWFHTNLRYSWRSPNPVCAGGRWKAVQWESLRKMALLDNNKPVGLMLPPAYCNSMFYFLCPFPERRILMIRVLSSGESRT
jgi:hypothetical protein